MAARPPFDLPARLAGVRALLIDIDGVLTLKGEPISGAGEALASLDRRGIPYVLATNVSLVGRATLSRDLARAGLSVPPERIVNAASAAAGYVRRRFGDAPLYVMAAPDALTEFAGLTLLAHDQAAEPGARVAAVLVGDAADDFTPRNLQSAFALLRAGASFVAMHKNRWWLTAAGETLDAGMYVAGMEYVTERRAIVTGKPARTFFAEGVRLLAGQVDDAAAGLSPSDVAMVGDDLWNDLLGAQKAGLRGVFVRSGKQGQVELDRIGAQTGGRVPDAAAPSIAEVVAALPG
jgi:HAD superfamily hydrolase (TIGR01458 family)